MVSAIGPIFLWKPSLCLSGRGISGPWTWIRFLGHYCHPQCMSKSATDLVFVKLLFRWSELWYSGFSNLTCTSPSWQNISKLDFTSSKILTFVREATVRRWEWGRGSLRASNPASCLWFALGTIRSLITYGGSVISIEICISLQTKRCVELMVLHTLKSLSYTSAGIVWYRHGDRSSVSLG